jgi:large subunit ribosomal protein L22
MAEKSKASIKIQRISVRKANLVASLIRKKDVSNAISILKNTPKKSSLIFLKLLNSAIANAVNNHGMNAEKLFISLILVNEGPTLKRFQPRAKGSAYSIFKRTSNLTIEVSER